ncbi:MAG: hypothetical protein V3S98_02400 [Dehalococcoidia bacterium]
MFQAKRALPLIVLTAIIAVLVAACGGDDPTPTPRPTPTTAAPAATATPSDGGTTAPAPTATPRPPSPTATPSGRDMEAHFGGKTIKIIVGFSPGGGYDTISRIFAAEASKHFPGNPQFVVSNLPGSGGLRALQTVTKSKGDGLTVVPMATGRFAVPEAIGEDVDGFDLFNAKFVGSATATERHNAYCIRRDVATTWEEALALDRTLLAGTSSPGGDVIGLAMMEFLGAPIKVVYGYGGTSEVQAAVDRGELDGTTRCDFNFVQDLFPEWIENQTIVPIFWWDVPIRPEWLEAIGAPEPPHLYDIIDVSDEQKTALEFGEATERLIRMFTLSEETPDDILEVWRESFKATLEDPAFLARADVANLDIAFGDGAELVELSAQAKDFSDEAKDMLKFMYGFD